jgi:DNA-binding NarL/FixJ family response regulator
VTCTLLLVDDHALIMCALESGAHGYLLKDTTANELEHALLALRNNERYLSPAIAHTVINQALVRSQGPTPPAGHSHNLTARQLEILRLIVRGKSTREIAHGLGLSIKTVEAHRSQIMKRLQIFDVAGLVLFAVRDLDIHPWQARPHKHGVQAPAIAHQFSQSTDHFLRRGQDADIQQAIIGHGAWT